MARGAGRRVVTVAAVTAGLGGLYRLSWRSGVTDEEAFGSLPGDEVVPHPMLEWTRGITIARSPAQVWPWLVQMGYHRGGWYTNEWVDRVIWRVDARNTDRILPECQDLSVGDVVPDGPECAAYFWVRAIEPERAIVYSSIRHPYRGHPIDPTDPEGLLRLEQRLVEGGKYIDFSWTFVLRPPRATVQPAAHPHPGQLRPQSSPCGQDPLGSPRRLLRPRSPERHRTASRSRPHMSGGQWPIFGRHSPALSGTT